MARVLTQVVLIGEAPGKNGKVGDSPLLGRIGKRLANLMGTNEYVYRWQTRRENLLQKWPGSARGNGSAWNAALARRAARRMEDGGLYARKGRVVILLGRRVSAAFGFARVPWFKAFYNGNVVVVVAPHPSGASRWWNDPKNWQEAKRFWTAVYRRMMA